MAHINKATMDGGRRKASFPAKAVSFCNRGQEKFTDTTWLLRIKNFTSMGTSGSGIRINVVSRSASQLFYRHGLSGP